MSVYDELGEKWKYTLTALDWWDSENHENPVSIDWLGPKCHSLKNPVSIKQPIRGGLISLWFYKENKLWD
jgi:hypothetical protein